MAKKRLDDLTLADVEVAKSYDLTPEKFLELSNFLITKHCNYAIEQYINDQRPAALEVIRQKIYKEEHENILQRLYEDTLAKISKNNITDKTNPIYKAAFDNAYKHFLDNKEEAFTKEIESRVETPLRKKLLQQLNEEFLSKEEALERSKHFLDTSRSIKLLSYASTIEAESFEKHLTTRNSSHTLLTVLMWTSYLAAIFLNYLLINRDYFTLLAANIATSAIIVSISLTHHQNTQKTKTLETLCTELKAQASLYASISEKFLYHSNITEKTPKKEVEEIFNYLLNDLNRYNSPQQRLHITPQSITKAKEILQEQESIEIDPNKIFQTP